MSTPLYEAHRIRGGRCVALSTEGKRCPKRAQWGGAYHGDSEWRSLSDEVPWVYVEMCEGHARPTWPGDIPEKSPRANRRGGSGV